tara:strand:- start:39 stop:359 length:321 start_codon:yes stop_codon:yes gene_type:complete
LSLAVAGSFAVGFGFFGERVFSASNNYFHICPIYRLGYRKTDKNMKPPFSTQQSKVESRKSSTSTSHCQLSMVKVKVKGNSNSNSLTLTNSQQAQFQLLDSTMPKD